MSTTFLTRLSAEHRGVRLLQLGTIKQGGSGCICPESALLRNLVTHLLVARNEVVILDMEAGIEHLGRGTAGAVDAFVIVVEPVRRSLDTALRIHKLATDIGVTRFLLVGNKVKDADDLQFIQTYCVDLPVAGHFPIDDRVSEADRAGVAVFDAVPEFVELARAIAQQVDLAAAPIDCRPCFLEVDRCEEGTWACLRTRACGLDGTEVDGAERCTWQAFTGIAPAFAVACFGYNGVELCSHLTGPTEIGCLPVLTWRGSMRILTIVQGIYGQRITANIQQGGDPAWTVDSWQAPRVLPPVIDYPEEFVPANLQPADLLISLGEHPGVAELLPDLARLCGAKAAIVPVDNVAWLPPGLMNQLARWLADLGVAAVFPKPFCSLTATTCGLHRNTTAYDVPLVAQFAQHFGRPELAMTFTADAAIAGGHGSARQPVRLRRFRGARPARCRRRICGVRDRDAPSPLSVPGEHGDRSRLQRHAMHVSGHLLQDEVARHVKPYKRSPVYLRPQGRSS